MHSILLFQEGLSMARPLRIEYPETVGDVHWLIGLQPISAVERQSRVHVKEFGDIPLHL